MHRLRNRLIAAFVVATVVPLLATIWIATSLLERSLSYATTEELDRLSGSLEETVREFYRRDRQALKDDVESDRLAPKYYAAADLDDWPAEVVDFWNGAEAERFQLSGPGGERLEFLRRRDTGVDAYARSLDGIRMEQVSADIRQARARVDAAEARDLERGFTLTLILLVAIVWMVSLASVIYLAYRISRPIQELTAGLTAFASGDLARRLEPDRNDEVGRAVAAFNDMAAQLEQNRERLVYLTQMASWESLARKTAHELKNSLTPIRLTVEEILARQAGGDRQFMEQAAQIVVNEVETLERRVRAFSEFSSEPEVEPEELDLNSVVEERVSFLKTGHPGTSYNFEFDVGGPRALADPDRVNGILTNLLENAAEAAGPDGTVLVTTSTENDSVIVEVHDSGPGLSREASRSLFEPTITFKKRGMGLGLSIARKNALLSGGDIIPVVGVLAGAAFRVVLPAAAGYSADSSARTRQ